MEVTRMTMRDLAQHIIAVAHQVNQPITNLQLQKVMYFTLQKALKDQKFDKNTIDQLYDSPFLVWRYGPVEKDIYEEYKVYGSDPITAAGANVAELEDLNNEILTLLQKDPFDLVEKSHQERFWEQHQSQIVGWRSDQAYALADILAGVKA